MRFLRIEAFDIARQKRLHHRMLRLPGLQQAAARLVAASGAPGRLLKELKGPLGRARIAIGETDVGVDDPNERQQRKIVALGDELRANDKVVRAGCRLIELMTQMFETAGEIGRENQRPGVGKKRLRLFSEPLDAGAASGEAVGLLARWAEMRARLDMAAMVTGELAAKAMLDQPGRTIGTLEAMAAGAAERQRRITAPIEEEERLFAFRPRLLDGGDQARRQPASARRSLAAQVDRRQIRQAARAKARGKFEPIVPALLGVDARLDRGRRRGEHDRRAFDPRSHHRHVARVVRRAVFLLVGRFVLLIDNDEAEIAERQEQGGAGAGDDANLAAGDRAPQAAAQTRWRARMPFGWPDAETPGETIEKLRRQGDFRQQDQRLSSRAKRLRQGLEIDLGLAGAGDAFQQRDGESAL